MSNQDRLLSDEELRKELAVIAQNTPAEFQVYTILAEEIAKRMLPLINTQKRLYAESVIGEDDLPITIKNKYSQSKKNTRNELRAEQRARIK